jgi:signal transduction histidine kinase
MAPHERNNGNAAWPDLLQRVVQVFPGAIILNDEFTILAVSLDVLDLLNMKPADLLGKKVSLLSNDPEFQKTIRRKLSEGSFKNYETYFQRKELSEIPIRISGFDAGDPSCKTNRLVLKINCARSSNSEDKLLDVTQQLESFLNSAWHELRGPIATIRGIMNLARTRKDDSEVNMFFDLIRIHTEKLDVELQDLLQKVHFVNRDPAKQ